MAFNWQTFRTRALTAIVFVAVMLTGLLWNEWSFLLLFSIIHFGCWWEYIKLVEKIHKIFFHPYVKLGLMVAGYGLMLWFCGSAYRISGYGLKENISLPLSAAGFVMLVMGIFQKTKIDLRSFGAAFLGLFYISLSWGLMINLYPGVDIHVHDSMYVLGESFFPIIIIACIWINDTMAYIAGSLIGKTPFSKISPKKTWEGTIGGIILCMAAMGLLFPLIFFGTIDPAFLIVIAPLALIISVTGTLGDLLESKLKRLAGVKDSGRLMPGHGGFMDRFDSLLVATPFAWLYLTALSM
jgi:phosphatidate cytidylyltransferase